MKKNIIPYSAVERAVIRIIIMLFFLLAIACSPEIERKIDKGKFAGLERAANAVKLSLSSNISYQQFGALLQRLSEEIATLGDRTKTAEEKELLKDYKSLLTFYQDGHLLWKYKLEFAPFDFVPKGRIYVGQDVEPIASKYNFPVKVHVYQPTRQPWKSISEDSIQAVWKNADFQLDVINKITSYH
jgi:hypothetical protein